MRLAEGRSAVCALRLRHRDGRLVPIQMRAHRIADGETGEELIVSVAWQLPDDTIPNLPVEGGYPAPPIP